MVAGKLLPCTPKSHDVRTMEPSRPVRSEEHTSELQSHVNLVCRLLLEKKKYRPHSTKLIKLNRTGRMRSISLMGNTTRQSLQPKAKPTRQFALPKAIDSKG